LPKQPVRPRLELLLDRGEYVHSLREFFGRNDPPLLCPTLRTNARRISQLDAVH
jgi:hypothetical protein